MYRFVQSVRRLVAVCLLLVFMSSCTLLNERIFSKDDSNATVARAVKVELINSETVDGVAIRVDVKGNTIVLKGSVESESESIEATKIAQALYPKHSVSNNIDIRE